MITQNPKVIEMEITKKELPYFVENPNKRNIRARAVEGLASDIRKGIGLKQPIHVNQLKENTYRIIDGNHRFAAIKDVIEKESMDKVKAQFKIYKGLTNEEESELFDILAKTVNQSLNDFLKLHYNEIALCKMIDQNGFPIPVSTYATKYESILLAHLLRAYYNANETMLEIPSKVRLLDWAKKLKREDYENLKEFFVEYKHNFGTPSPQSPYYRAVVVWAMMSIHQINKGMMTKTELWDRLKTKLYDHPLILELARYQNKEFANDQRRRIIERLNKGWRGNQFI